jgi:hypothetical protein
MHEDMKKLTNIWSENQKGRDHLEDIGVDGRISKCIFRKQGVRMWSAFSWLRS